MGSTFAPGQQEDPQCVCHTLIRLHHRALCLRHHTKKSHIANKDREEKRLTVTVVLILYTIPLVLTTPCKGREGRGQGE